MTGNAWQWVADWYHADYFAMQAKEYGNSVVNNPLGPVTRMILMIMAFHPALQSESFVVDPFYAMKITASRIVQAHAGVQIHIALCRI